MGFKIECIERRKTDLISRQSRSARHGIFPSINRLGVVAGLVVVLAAMLVGLFPAQAQEQAKAAEGPPLKVGVFVSTDASKCSDAGNLQAVRRFTSHVEQRINSTGGIAGRPLQVEIVQDKKSVIAAVTRAKMWKSDENTLALIGLSNPGRVRLLLHHLADAPQSAGQAARVSIPFITDAAMDLRRLKRHSVFSMQPSQAKVRVPVIAAFLAATNFQRVSVIGLTGTESGKAFAEGLATALPPGRFKANHFVKSQVLAGADSADDKAQAAIKSLVAKVSAADPDVIVLDIPTAMTESLITEIFAGDRRPALFLTGGLEDLPLGVSIISQPGPMYSLAWDRLPEVYNEKLRNLIDRDQAGSWVFSCSGAGAEENPDPYFFRNLAAIDIGTRYADMVGLVAAAARTTVGRKPNVARLRATVAAALRDAYAPGRSAFKGIFRNWSFDPVTRSVARTPFIVIQPHTIGSPQLAPAQFVRLPKGNFRQIETLYLDIDMIRLHNIDDNDKTFFAEFYLAVRSPDGAKTNQIDRIEFTNAYLDPKSRGGRQMTITRLHDGGPSEAYPQFMQMYKVAGRFFFEPKLANFPFDAQQFSIDLQPRNSDAPFIIQPPPLTLRDRNLTTEGWKPKAQHVGYAADFVPVVDAFLHQPGVVPFFKASFVWAMKRETTDYFLRVVVPLAFILIVAYLSIFIPQSHLEAIVTIQITALLSAVALYLSLPKLETDTATISDRIFVFDYMMVSVMIVISILRINTRIQKLSWLNGLLSFIHITVIPGIVAYMAYVIYTTTIAQS